MAAMILCCHFSRYTELSAKASSSADLSDPVSWSEQPKKATHPLALFQAVGSRL